jgi:glycosyltransferase involved in cell wall biosynthesis
MKIAILAPPWISIPPPGYGGIENFISNLALNLFKRGHKIVLYTTGDSNLSVPILYYYKKALGNDKSMKLNPYNIVAHFHYFYKKYSSQFDIIHNNAAELALYFADFSNSLTIHTLHNNYYDNKRDILAKYHWLEGQKMALTTFKNSPFIAISNYQRLAIPYLNYIKTIYNGINTLSFKLGEGNKSYIIFFGRIDPVKGADIAIEVAKKTSKELLIAGFVDKGKKKYFQSKIIPNVDNKKILLSTEMINHEKKIQLFGEAKLFLSPICWEEPFGLVMIEAMATGTPVVAFARGSVPEVIKDGETGFIVNPSDDDIRGDFIIKKTGIEGLCEAVERIYSMPEDQYRKMRKACREHVEKNFTVEKMVDEYEKVYEEIISQRK